MFGRFRKGAKAPAEDDAARDNATDAPSARGGETPAPDDGTPEARGGLFGRLRSALGGTSERLFGGVRDMLVRGRPLDAELLDELETALLTADVGVAATERLLGELKARAKSASADADPAELLRESVHAILAPVEQPLVVDAAAKPFVILVVGVNGTGKTTTIGKLAHHYARGGQRVMMAAGDTFRAAAVQQLQTWGERADVPVVAQAQGADSAAVIFDAASSAKAREFDVLLADTAGRLHTQGNLMDELRKVRRVVGKVDADAPHETLLVLDAGIGQNAIAQARQFTEAVAVSGLVLTKLDGTAKGGVILALAEELGLPVRFVGVGEGLEDLRPFDADAFARALIA